MKLVLFRVVGTVQLLGSVFFPRLRDARYGPKVSDFILVILLIEYIINIYETKFQEIYNYIIYSSVLKYR